MKYFVDGDQVVVTKDDFVDLQESPIVFVAKDSEAGETICKIGIAGLAIGDLIAITRLLDSGGGEFRGARPVWQRL